MMGKKWGGGVGERGGIGGMCTDYTK